MAIKIYKKNNQVYGEFNNGDIIENKPIGFPQDGIGLRPYSTLFYWANAIGVKESTIGLHPHQGFEIMTFVLEGKIEHYDTKNRNWIPLEKGQVQIIRSGSGIHHSEKALEGSRFFQIWFDPNLRESIKKDATYNDHKANEFPSSNIKGISTVTYLGKGSPIVMDTPNLNIYESMADEGFHRIYLEDSKVLSLYLIEGDMKIIGQQVQSDDFIVVENEHIIEIEFLSPCRYFIIESDKEVPYSTYSAMYN